MAADSDERTAARAALEAPIRALSAAGDHAGATTAALRLYGSELLGFLHARARNDDLAAEAFAELGEDVWRGLPGFRWESSLRCWLYLLARNALGQLVRDPRRRRDRNLPLSAAPEVVAAVRTVTAEYHKTEVKDELRVLREQLSSEEHELLLLRLDRDLSWKEIAEVLGGEGDVAARAATLRKRFERAKERLRKLAIEHGLLDR
jgi:RNA polymerase sigma-70 factor (ECF subfamily)